MSEVISGKRARALLARARALRAAAAEVTRQSEALEREVRDKFNAVRAELVQRQLESIPVARLRETTEGRLRLGPLEAAGYRTVADVASASSSRLEQVEGVGPQTASQAVAAARQLASAVEESIAVRLDPDDRAAGPDRPPRGGSGLRPSRASDITFAEPDRRSVRHATSAARRSGPSWQPVRGCSSRERNGGPPRSVRLSGCRAWSTTRRSDPSDWR
ncbi:MAG: helix-hairpin-helix domain-containing protein [Egibacteraceae bacterium]